MKKLICLMLCAVLLTGCAAGKAHETTQATETEKKSGWSVEGVENTGTENAQTDEEISENEQDSMLEGEEGENSTSPADEVGSGTGSSGSATLEGRRDIVEAEMRRMMSVLWTPTQDITYSLVNSSKGVAEDSKTQPDQIITLYAGRIYQGIPYAHGGGSGDSFLDQSISVSQNGVYTLDLTSADLNGYSSQGVNTCSRLGNDCADAIFWAWSRVSSSISFPGSGRMTEAYGCVKVGDYAQPYDDLRVLDNTKGICQDNGIEKMFDCYAQLQKGDAATNCGHGVMIVSNHVVRDDDGGIDGEKSYVVILDQSSTCEKAQTSYYNAQLGKTVYLCEELDKKWTYDYLFEKGYLPVTCAELIDESALAKETVTDSLSTPNVSNMFTGTVRANYRISSVTVTITDSKGKVVQSATCYSKMNENGVFQLSRFTDSVEKQVMKGSVDLDKLSAGSYKCEFTCLTATGKTHTFRSFSFTK